MPCEEGLGRAFQSASWRSRNKGGEDTTVCTRRRAEKPGMHGASAAAMDPKEQGQSGGSSGLCPPRLLHGLPSDQAQLGIHQLSNSRQTWNDNFA